jgi:hypothetical protein
MTGEGWTSEEERFRAAFRGARDQARGLKREADGIRPRGIIIPAGGARLFTCAWVAVRMLRDVLKTSLPIQVWHLGEQEMSPAMIALLGEQQVETVDALTLIGREQAVELGGFELKSFALLNCAFREVVLMDADNVPLIDPEELFSQPAYVESGAVFWPDLVSLSASSRIWDLCGVAYRSMPSFESGQLAVNRERHSPALALSWFLNRNARLVYRHIYGDKDSFLMAWLALEAPFHLIGHPARRLHGTICQHHPDGRLMFQHRNQRKWILHGENPTTGGFLEEERCLGYLADLRSRWSGRVFRPPAADSEMMMLAEGLMAQRAFRLETVSVRSELIELLAGNLARRRGRPVQWWLSREDGEITLSIGEDMVIRRMFRRHSPDYWRSPASHRGEQDLVLTAEHVPLALTPRGHSSDGIDLILGDWTGNYDRLDPWRPA